MRISALFMLAAIVAAGFASCNKKATTEIGDLKIVPYRNGDLWGFSDAKGNMLVEPKYSNAYLLDDGFGRIYQGESTGLVSPDGKVLAEPEYMYISMFKNGLAAFRNNNDTLSGYLNEQGQVAIPAQFEEANDFEDGYAIVKKGGQYQLIQPDGAVIKTIGKWMPLPGGDMFLSNPGFEADKGYIQVQDIGNESYSMGLIDTKGNTVLEPAYQFLSLPVEGIMVAQKGEKYGLIRTDGSTVVEMKYDLIYQIGAGRYLVQQTESSYAVMDQTGKMVIPAEYSSISAGPADTYIAYKGESVGLLDNTGKVLVPFEYNYLLSSRNYLIASKGEGKTGIISTTNQVLLPLEYDHVEVVAPGRFQVDKNGKRGLLDDKGKTLLPIEFDMPTHGEGGEYIEAMERPYTAILFQKGGKGHLYNLNGKKISEKQWTFCGVPDAFGLTYATDINGRESYIGPDGAIYSKDAPLKKVTVNNAQALFDAIGNDVEITLEDGKYDLSTVNGGSEFADIFDFSEYQMEDRTIRIKDVKNLHFVAKNKGKVEWVIPYAFIPVFKIEGGFNISFSGITMGHDVQKGLCEGAVMTVLNANYLHIENCDLYGSGTMGIEAEGVSFLTMQRSVIRECTYGILSLMSSNSFVFDDCTFKDNTGDNMVKLQFAYGLKFNNSQFINNQTPKEYGPYEFFRFQDDNQTVSLNNCTFTNCTSDYFATYAEAIEEKNVNRKGLKTNKGLWRQKEAHITQWPEGETVEEAVEGE